MLVVKVGSVGPGGPVKIAVNTKVRYPMKLRNLLVFLRPAGHSFADWIVVPRGGRRKPRGAVK